MNKKEIELKEESIRIAKEANSMNATKIDVLKESNIILRQQVDLLNQLCGNM